MDLPTTQHTATVVAYADGTASIYISNGGGYLGGSESYKAIQDAGLKMILIARKFQPTMQLTKQFPLPEGGVIFFYVVTIDGVYTARAPQEELNQRTHPLTEYMRRARRSLPNTVLTWQRNDPDSNKIVNSPV